MILYIVDQDLQTATLRLLASSLSTLSTSIKMSLRLPSVQFLLYLITLGSIILSSVATQLSSSGNLTNNLPNLPSLGDPPRAPVIVGKTYTYSDDGIHYCGFIPRRLTRSSRVPMFYELTPLLVDALSYAYNNVAQFGSSSSSYMPARGYMYNRQSITMSFHHNWRESHGVGFGALELCTRKLAVWAQHFEFSNSDIEYSVKNGGESKVKGLGYITFS